MYFQCARDGDEESMMALLEHLGDRKKKMINKWDDYTNRMTPLHYAARYNHFRIVELLVQNGASTITFTYTLLLIRYYL